MVQRLRYTSCLEWTLAGSTSHLGATFDVTPSSWQALGNGRRAPSAFPSSLTRSAVLAPWSPARVPPGVSKPQGGCEWGISRSKWADGLYRWQAGKPEFEKKKRKYFLVFHLDSIPWGRRVKSSERLGFEPGNTRPQVWIQEGRGYSRLNCGFLF